MNIFIRILGVSIVTILGLSLFTDDLNASTKLSYTIARIEIYSKAIERYRIDVGQYPNNNHGLKSLITKPDNVNNWKGPYIEYPIILTDSWDHEFIYYFPPKYGVLPFDLYSYGPDGIDNRGQNDDISNWMNEK